MNYYQVWVRSHRYQQSDPLTYQSGRALEPGQVVSVPLGSQTVDGFISSQVSRPTFTCKPIANVWPYRIPTNLLKLLSWLKAYYPSPIGPLTQLVLPASLPKDYLPSIDSVTALKLAPLNPAQAEAVQAISQPGSYLLHGRTGSGKTHIYAALAKAKLEAGRSVIVLNPEIGLTPQLEQNLERLVGVKPIVLHSKMTAKQRAISWAGLATAKTPQLVVGPRSALFAPLHNVGLIVVDEAHETAYKQEQQPHYYAPRVASHLATIHQASLVLGSATPNIVDYFLAEQKHRPIITLNQLATNQAQPVRLAIVDCKDHALFTRSPHLSKPLIAAITDNLAQQRQTMLYLNRRGTARLAMCQDCGWQATCPNCDLALVYHGDTHHLICHACGHRQAAPSVCPACQSQAVVFKTAGTKAIESEVKRLFPEARIARYDTDNNKADSLAQNYQQIKAGDVDIIIGTQLIAKGLDLPQLTTLGIISADSSLAIPDFTAQERTYQLISQVIGRVGRGHQATAEVILQTYQPNNATLKAAVNGDWSDFYKNELAERQRYNFPPFCHLLTIKARRASPASASRACEQLAERLRQELPELVIDGPAPAFHEHAGGKYNWQLVVKAHRRQLLLDAIRHIPAGSWSYDIDPVNLL